MALEYVKGTEAMDYAACNIVYVDRTAGEDRLLKRGDTLTKSHDANSAEAGDPTHSARKHVEDNLRILLEVFSEGM